MASVNKVTLDLDVVRNLYCAMQMSIPQVSQQTGVSRSAIRCVLARNELLRTRADAIRLAASDGRLGSGRRGKKIVMSDQWKENISKAKIAHGEKNATGFSIKPSGYIEITRGVNKGKSAHVAAIEALIGRKLFSNEVVHHKDENRQNNALDNLELMTRSEHASHHGKINSLNRKRKQNGKFE